MPRSVVRATDGAFVSCDHSSIKQQALLFCQAVFERYGRDSNPRSRASRHPLAEGFPLATWIPYRIDTMVFNRYELTILAANVYDGEAQCVIGTLLSR